MKYLIYAVTVLFTGAGSVAAQSTEIVPNSGNAPRVFKVYNNPTQDKTDQFEITGLGGTTFTASNTADGTANSFNHSVQIIVGLSTNKAGNNNFQLNFYSGTAGIQQAASYTEGTLNIFYPVELYDAVRTKLEQAFAAKKKVTVKVIQKPNGYREGTLIL